MTVPGITVDLNELIENLWPEIYRFIYYKVQNKEEAEELTQDTFKRVLPKLQENKVEKEKIRAYVFQAARNLLKDLWRSRARNPKMVNIEDVQEGAVRDHSQERKHEDKIVIQEAMAGLSEDYRYVIKLRIVEGYSVKETALKMNRSQGAVRSLQYRAVQSLKEILEERGFFHE